jgi:hypothetical protein
MIHLSFEVNLKKEFLQHLGVRVSNHPTPIIIQVTKTNNTIPDQTCHLENKQNPYGLPSKYYFILMMGQSKWPIALLLLLLFLNYFYKFCS